MLVACAEGSEKVREDEDVLYFVWHNTTPVIQFKINQSQNAPHETWIQSSDLLLSCQLILREGVER